MRSLALLVLLSWPLAYVDLMVATLRKPRDHVWACAERRCWQWKEWLLGDGHDFFVPRPRATRSLAQWLQQELGVEEAPRQVFKR